MQLGLTITSVSLEAAEALIDAAVARSNETGKKMVIAVVDAAGNLKAFRRMDGSPSLSVDIAINKAWTAASYGYPTHGWNAFLAGDEGVRQIAHTPRLVTFGGGYPIMIDGELAGGLGISGGHYSEDQDVAEAALKALGLPC
jgi:uncharacterized protein GlcG (DUF336 family)